MSIILIKNIIISIADKGVKSKLRIFDVYYDIYIFLIETKTVCCYKQTSLLNMKTINDCFLSLDVTNLKVCSLAAFYPTAVIIVTFT